MKAILLKSRRAARLCGLLAAWLVFLTFSTAAPAHEVRPTVADITITESEVTLTLFVVLEPLIVGMDLRSIANTNDSPLAAEHDALRALPPEELRAALEAAWPRLKGEIVLKAGDRVLDTEIAAAEIGEIGDVALPRESSLTLRADLPADNSPVSVVWGEKLGLLALRQTGGEDAYEGLIAAGDSSPALPRTGVLDEGFLAFFARYVNIGFIHIVPLGADHILFVLGLFLFSLKLGPIIWQVTAFTTAHTLTLALASLGLVSVSPAVVEPLIAASITYVAVENIVGARLGWRRIAVVFGFGLLHGLGFAAVLGDIGLQPARFITGLIGFNVGVELGQLAVILGAYLLVGLWFGNKPWYRQRVTIPASVVIGLIGLWWFLQRTVL